MEKKLRKVFTSFKTRAEGASSGTSQSASHSSRTKNISAPLASNGTPEGDLLQAVHLFVATGGPDNPNPGEEFLHLPVIVDNAESSPSAALQAAIAIRKNLDAKHVSRPYIHYNSIMLLRILSQNPGYTFTRHLNDPKLLAAVKELLRNGRDPSVYQILGETLEYFSTEPALIADEGLDALRALWAKDKARQNAAPTPIIAAMPPPLGQSHPPPPTRPVLPSAAELAARISEATTSAGLLTQLVQSTPQAELSGSTLIKEFADRCKLASKSIQSYITADNPAPDEDTIATLIETNDLIATALERHRKAVAAALKTRERLAGEPAARIQDPAAEDPATMYGAPDSRPETPTGRHQEQQMSPVSPVTPEATRQPEKATMFRF